VSFATFHNKLIFIVPAPKLEDHPLSAVHNCLFNVLCPVQYFCKACGFKIIRRKEGDVPELLRYAYISELIYIQQSTMGVLITRNITEALIFNDN
jgi:hypothetical protein